MSSDPAASQHRRPNVILIMADQLPADALGYAGNPIVRTPNIDRLAASGVAFDSAFTNCPVCMASRGAIHTGRYPSTLKMRSMGVLVPDEVTIAETLRLQGYRTGLFGKLHFLPMVYTRDTLQCEYEPLDVEPYLEPAGIASAGTLAAFRDPAKKQYGFDVSRGISDLNWGHYLDWLEEKSPEHVAIHESENWPSGRRPDTYGNSPAQRMFYPDVPDFFDSNMEVEFHPSRFVADRAIEFIREQASKPDTANPASEAVDPGTADPQPFFAHISFVDPHHPFNAPVGVKERYNPDDMPSPLSLLGIEANSGVQGADRTDLLDGKSDSGRERVLCELDHITPKHRASYALRTADWKLIYHPDVQTGMLFDLGSDPGELVNRYFDPTCVEVRQKMMSELVDEIYAQKDPLPVRLSKA